MNLFLITVYTNSCSTTELQILHTLFSDGSSLSEQAFVGGSNSNN